MSITEPPPRWKVLLAFAAIYLIWGSSYLGVRFAIETIPPFLMAGLRFTLAGTILILWRRQRGETWPTRANWQAAVISGSLLFLTANGAVVWATQHVPSGIVSIMGATIPLWMTLIDWLRYSSARPGTRVFVGVALGMVGIVLLISPGQLAGGGPIYPPAALALIVGPLGWSIGSLYSRHADLPASPMMSTGMQLFAGGLLMLILSLGTGEVAGFQPALVSLRSVLAFIYLFTIASIVAFSAYVWLLHVSTPARVSTYAFVNPVVAVFLGAALANEPLTPRTLIAAAVILAGVILIVLYRARGGKQVRLRWKAPVTVEQPASRS